MILDPQEWLQIELLAGKPQEPLTAALIRRLLRPGDTFVDVGAHVGWFSLQAAKAVGPTGRVVAVDPQPYNCERILANAAANEFANITVVVGAIGDVEGTVLLPNQCVTDKARLTLAGPGVNDTSLSFLTTTYTLPGLDEALGLGRIRVLKVDVEGFELPVFRAARPILRNVENIVFEALPENDRDADTIAAILKEAGFGVASVEGRPLESRPVPENNIWARRPSST